MSGERILIVEDEEALRESLRRVLEREGYIVEAVDSSEAAFTELECHTCDLVLTDIILPGMSGLEFLKRCRSLNPGLVVVIMTAYATIETAVDAIRAGAHEYLVKPLNHEDLKRVIRKALDGHGDAT